MHRQINQKYVGKYYIHFKYFKIVIKNLTKLYTRLIDMLFEYNNLYDSIDSLLVIHQQIMNNF